MELKNMLRGCLPVLVCFQASMLLSATVLAQQVQPDNTPPSALSLRGFGTLGLARSTNSQAEVARDILQPRGVSNQWSGRIDSNIGLQANFAAMDSVDAVVQAVSRYNYKGNFSPELTWAFLKYEPSAYLSLRGGRVGTDFLMRGDSRLIGYSQLEVRPNVDSFSLLPFSYLDGADMQLTLPVGNGLLRGKTYLGVFREEAPFPTGYLDIRGALAFGGHLDYQNANWQWRAGYGQVRFNHPMPSPVGELRDALNGTGIGSAQQAADALDLEGSLGRYYSIGMVYEDGPLITQITLGRFRYQSPAIQNQDSGMLLFGYRVGDVTSFAGYSRVKSHARLVTTGLPDVGSWASINSSLASVLAQTHANQHTYSVGLRWDFQRNAALKFQADIIRGTPESIYPVRNETANWNGRTHVFSMALDFVF